MCLREMKMPIFRFMVLNYVNALIEGTVIAENLRHREVRRHWYYNWLHRCHRLKMADITPLELTGAQWATPENAKKHYDTLSEILVDKGLAAVNPAYDEQVPYSVRLIITRPERIFSMDETHLTNDNWENSKSKINRNAVASGWSREVLSNKSGGDGTAIGGSSADGKDLPAFFIFASNIVHPGDVQPYSLPLCRRMNPLDPTQPLPCRFFCKDKDGVTEDVGVRYVRGASSRAFRT